MTALSLQAKQACLTEPESKPALSLDPGSGLVSSCFQERILTAFWQEPDARVCLAHQSDDAFLSCVVVGSYLNMLMRNVAKGHGGFSPPTLGPREWLDSTAGQAFAFEYINSRNEYLCGYGGYARRAKCAYDIRLEIFGMSEEESELCEDLDEPEECQMNTSLRLFIERATLLAG